MDDTRPASATGPPAATAPPPAAAVETANGGAQNGHAPAVDSPDWRSVIDGVDPEELRRHPKFAGVLGQMVDGAMRRWQADQEGHVSRQAAENAERELTELAQSDPDAFAARFLTDKQREKALGQIETIRREEAKAMARRVGQAYAAIPGWDRLTAADHEVLARAIMGKPDDEVVAAYNATALALLTKYRVEDEASNRMDTWTKTKLEHERKAIREEEAAKLLKAEPRPDIRGAMRGPAVVDFNRMSDADYDKWYETEGPGRELGLRTR